MVRRILVAMDGSPHDEAAAALAIDWGSRFGAELVGLRILDKPSITRPEPVSVILEEAHQRRPRLLVMGAHGHHPVRDLFCTSVTRAVPKDTPVPVMAGA